MTLTRRVQEQFQSNPHLRVLFFFDPDGTCREEVEGWNHEQVRCLVAGPALFSLKYRLEHALKDEPVLLYTPEPRPSDLKSYPLADLLTANRELRIDRVAEFLDQFELDRQHRDLVKQYFKGELEYKNRQQFLSTTLTNHRLTEHSLQRGLAAYHLDLFRTVPREEQLLAGILYMAADAEAFEAYRARCEGLGLTDFLGRLLAEQFELDSTSFTLENVLTAAQKMKYNLLMRPVDAVRSDDPYRKLRIQSTLTLNRIGGLANGWRESSALERSPEEVLGMLAPEVDETKLLDVYGPKTTLGYMTPTLRRRRVEQALGYLKAEPSRAKETVSDLRTSTDQEAAGAAEVVWQMASFYQVLRGYKTLDLGSLDAFLRTYAEELYRCDAHYRHAVAAFRRLRHAAPAFESILSEPYDGFLHDYHDTYVHPLNTAWQRVLVEQVGLVKDFGTHHQGTFFTRYAATDDQKTAVIISDALRFEAAKELADRLVQADSRKQATLQPMLAALPTVTAVGMAHLLPHQGIRTQGDGFEIEGIPTSGTANRERILQATRQDSRAVTFDDLQALSEREGRDLFKEYPLVYIYHDRIDASGDHRKTESDTVPAVEQTLQELHKLIRTLNNWNVYRVVITADHGFLYSEQDLPESMQEAFPQATGTVLRKNRCVVAQHCAEESGYRFPLRSVSDIDADLEVCVPRAVNRYRLQGAGKRFAHGGASLQEMVVPALEVKKVREDRAEKVGVRLLSPDRIIRSGALSVQILQTQAVSSSYQARRILVGLYDDQGTLVSNEQHLTLDATSSDPTERTRKLILTLGPEANQLNFCHLRSFDEDDLNRLNPIVEQRYSIQRLIEQDDF